MKQKEEEQEQLRKEYDGRENDQELIDAVNKIGNRFKQNKAKQLKLQEQKNVNSMREVKIQGDSNAVVDECVEEN